MGLFDKMFQSSDDDEPVRQLDHPRDLMSGDIIKFGFMTLAAISNENFTVQGVHTYDLGGEQQKKTRFLLRGQEDILYRLAIINNAQGESLELAKSIAPDDVALLFDMDAFIWLLDSDSGTHHTLKRILKKQRIPEQFSSWTDKKYHQEAGQNAYFYRQDYRHRHMPTAANTGQEFSYYSLISDKRTHGLEVHVFDGGYTEVYLLAYVPIYHIEELWPKQGAGNR